MEEQIFGVAQGWQCPICKRVYSPFVQMCMYCGKKYIQMPTIPTTTVTRLPQEQKK